MPPINDATALQSKADEGSGRWPWQPWAVIYFGCALTSLLTGNHCQNRPTQCMDPFWLEAWLLQPQHGFHVRGLLGLLTHLTTPRGPDVLVLNIIALLISIGVVATLACWLYRRATTLWGRLAIAVLLGSPPCAVFFAQLGDPLSIVLALFLVTLWCLRRIDNQIGRWLVAGAFCVVGVAIHEASIFLFLPAIVLVCAEQGPPTRASYIKYAVLAMPFLLLAVIPNSVRPPDPQFHAFNSLTGEIIPHQAKPFPSYREMIPEVWAFYVSTPRRAAIFALKFARVWPFQLLVMLLVAGLIVRGAAARALWRRWLYLYVCSIPLYLVAVDWGRFSTLTFWIAILATLARDSPSMPEAALCLPKIIRPLVPQRMPADGVLFGVVASLVLGANAVYREFQVNGIPVKSVPILLPLIVAWAMWRRWSSSAPQVSGPQSNLND